jgi:hypothetical protein
MLTGIFGELSQDHAAALVARLRAVRRQRRLTLLQVEHQSAGRFNAIVVGSDDRGDRAATLPKSVDWRPHTAGSTCLGSPRCLSGRLGRWPGTPRRSVPSARTTTAMP